MAQNLVIFNRLGRREDLWRCLISTILAFCIITCGAVSEQKGGQRGRESETIPRSCQHIVSGVQENDQGSNSSSKTQFEPYRKGGRRVDVNAELDFQELDAISQVEFTFTARQGPFSASEGLSRRSISFRVDRSSKIANEVYLVSGQLYLAIDEDKPGRTLFMDVHLEGVFSKRTGRFCSTGCAGAPVLEADANYKKTSKGQKFNDHLHRHLMTPARLEYVVEHPESDSVPDALVERDCEVHVELKSPRTKTIENPLATGVMASLRSPEDPSYFHPLNISGISESPYEFDTSVQRKAQILGQSATSDISGDRVRENIQVWSSDLSLCAGSSSSLWINLYPPIWNSSCHSGREGGFCSPFHNLNISRLVSSKMRIRNIHCSSDWNLISAAFEFDFTQSDTASPGSKATKTSTTFLLFAEGSWASSDKPGQVSGQVVMVAHYLGSDGTALDTQIEITLQIPMVQTIHHRYGIIGHVRSTRSQASDALYFLPFSFLGDLHGTPYAHRATWTSQEVFHPSYVYDSSIQLNIQPVCSLAAKTHKSHRTASFPDGSRVTDLEFQFSVAIPGLGASQQFPYLQNRFIGQKFNDPWGGRLIDNQNQDKPTDPPPTNRLIPVSFRYSYQENLAIETEGYYDTSAGHLCMLGCRRRWEDVAAPYEDDEIWNLNASQIESCDLVFSIQYPPANPGLWGKSPFVTGSITSLLAAGHPLYFKPLVLKSAWPITYSSETAWTVLRRNAETIMSLATLSFATLLIAVQVGYSSRESNFKNLRYLSFVMMSILISRHVLPLLLSFNSFWGKSVPVNRMHGNLSGFSGWPETHEVVVRGTSMVALLLELRLLQLVWKSRTSAKSNPQISTAESPRKVSDVAVVLTCLPLYATMILVVGFVHWSRHWERGGDEQYPYTSSYDYLESGEGVTVKSFDNYRNGQTIGAFLWADLQALSGVIVDLFLLPQVIANVLWDTEGKIAPLYPLFYIGMTVVRSAQHLFDAFRESNFTRESYSSSYYYANPNWDLYSTEWDFIIPGCSVVLAIFLLLQQKYGGRCFIPTRSRRHSVFFGCSRCLAALFGHRISNQLVGFQYENL